MTDMDHSRAQAQYAAKQPKKDLFAVREVRLIEAEEFREHLFQQSFVNYQQTPEWAEIRREQWQPELLGWFDATGTRIGVCVIRYRTVPGIRQRFAYIPRGPLFDWAGVDVASAMDGLRNYLSARGVFAVRMTPSIHRRTWRSEAVRRGLSDPTLHQLTEIDPDDADPVAERVEDVLRSQGWRQLKEDESFEDTQGRFSYSLPLAGKTEDMVFTAMSKSWRRSVNKASREGVMLRQAVREDLPTVHRLYGETARRNGFAPRSLSFFESVWDQFGAGRSGRFYLDLGCYEEEILSADSIVQVGSSAHGLFGANSLARPQLNMSNAIHWMQIRRAIADGAREYDIGGVTPVLHEDHPQGGLLRFKAGLGGEVRESFGTWDLAIRPTVYSVFKNLYPLYNSLAALRR